MSLDIAALDLHIERLRKGETLTENEVRALCEKVNNGSDNDAAVEILCGFCIDKDPGVEKST